MTCKRSIRLEFESHLDDRRINFNLEMDILTYWSGNGGFYRHGKVAKGAGDILSIPLLTLAPESSFCVSKKLMNPQGTSPCWRLEVICRRVTNISPMRMITTIVFGGDK
ncbi:hypothetical protein CRG98_007853 [Punica granatum]|nr:hypothetical protein CRG98_007853 [Punica granatum]